MIFIKNKWNLIVIDEGLSHFDNNVRKIIIKELERRASEGTEIVIVDHNLNRDEKSGCWNEIVLEKIYE